ncbi:hypothetical protein [Pikeienuella sp. HZG-20]|uniref:hypothetical protein n=1 Tax=Paludibacillus litoralis TaxID=3133267 RepID=UPI0030EC3864
MNDLSASDIRASRVTRLALEFRPDAFLLHRRDGAEAWREAAAAPLPEAALAPDFDAAIAAIADAARAIGAADPPEVELWLPPERILFANLEPGLAPEGAFDEAEDAEALSIAVSPDGAAAAAVAREVVDEAVAYARRHGFEPTRVGAQAALALFPDGPEFLPEPAPAPVAERAAPAIPSALRWFRPGRAILTGAAALIAALGIWLGAGFPADEAPPAMAGAPAALAAPDVAEGFAPPPPPAAGRPAGVIAAAFSAPEAPAARPVVLGAPPPSFTLDVAAPPRPAERAGREAAPVAPPPDAPHPPAAAPTLVAPAPAARGSDPAIGAEPIASAAPGPGAVAEAPPPIPAPDPAEADPDPPGPGAAARAPRPAPRPAALDMSPSESVATLAPAPKARPKSIRPHAPATAAPAPALSIGTKGVREVKTPRRGAPRAPGVAGAATLKDVIPLDDMNLLGVFGEEGARRALVRLPSGKMLRVSSGTVVDGWLVGRIDATSMRITRSGEARVLDLAQ